MNNINPLYFLLFFASVALFMIYQTDKIDDKISSAVQNNTSLEKTGQYVNTLKNRWKNPKESRKRVDSILSLPIFKANIYKKNYKKGVYRIELKSLSAKQLDKIINKFFNESLSIKKMIILRNANRSVNLTMEFNL